MRRFKQPNIGADTETVQAVVTKNTARKLRKAAKKRKMSASAFIAVAIEDKLDAVDADRETTAA